MFKQSQVNYSCFMVAYSSGCCSASAMNPVQPISCWICEGQLASNVQGVTLQAFEPASPREASAVSLESACVHTWHLLP